LSAKQRAVSPITAPRPAANHKHRARDLCRVGAWAEPHEDGDESLELRASPAAFLGPRSVPATTVNPGAFAAAVTRADAVPSIDSTAWQELGPYSYFPDDSPQG
jgi:hypothetical protein